MAYNGHKSHAAWNVSLWINNDEGLYNMARGHLRRYGRTRDEAAAAMLSDLIEIGATHTPDGVPYTKTNIRLAMVGM